MTTLTALKSEIADDLARDDMTSQIAEAITEAITHYQDSPFWFSESRDKTFTTVDGQGAYTSSDDTDIPNFYRIDSLWLEDGGEVYEMACIDYEEWQALQSTGSTARPYNYARLNEALYLFPTPNDAYTVRMIGHEKIAAPATDGEADNPWMTDAYQLIRARAVKNVYAKKLRSYQDAQIWEGEERDQYDRIERESNRRVASGRIMSEPF